MYAKPFFENHQYFLNDISSKEAFEMILTKLKNNEPKLDGLDLQQQLELYGDAKAEKLSKSIENNTTIKYLGLRGNQLGDAGTKNLSKALKVNSSLTSINLSFNQISSIGAKDLSEALKINTSLKRLDLSGNNIGNAGVEDLSEALKINTSLNVLSLVSNYIGDSGAKDLSEVLKTNTSLTCLHLDGYHNYIKEKGKGYLIQALASNYTLLELTGVYDSLISKYLDRNNSLNDCLKPLNKALNDSDLILNSDYIEYMLDRLQKLFPDLNSLPSDSYPFEAYRILTALNYLSSPKKETKQEVLSTLSLPFKHKPYQGYADKIKDKLQEDNLNDLIQEANRLREKLAGLEQQQLNIALILKFLDGQKAEEVENENKSNCNFFRM